MQKQWGSAPTLTVIYTMHQLAHCPCDGSGGSEIGLFDGSVAHHAVAVVPIHPVPTIDKDHTMDNSKQCWNKRNKHRMTNIRNVAVKFGIFIRKVRKSNVAVRVKHNRSEKK